MKITPSIIILDFGSQYSPLIARKVRELGVFCTVLPWTISEAELRALQPKGIILSGGPESVNMPLAPKAPPIVFELGVPVLGICYGMQTMAVQLGGCVQAGKQCEFGAAELELVELPEALQVASLFDLSEKKITVWMSHGDHVTTLPPGFLVTAKSNVEFAAMMDPSHHFYGFQFHPEVTHTPRGKTMLKRFVIDICRCESNWQPQQIISQLIQSIREQVKNEKVILAFSGGVDSSVTATLLHQAIGDQLECVFIDTGMLRKNEMEQVRKMFQEARHFKLTFVNASDLFLNALKGVVDPEEKRKIIGKTFIDVFEKESRRVGNIQWLAQGTIYSDVIESAQASYGASHVIKSHHNVGGLPEKMHLKLIEPLRVLFKDEVRQVGLSLGLPYEWLYRHPFPGAGLGVRVLGEVTPSAIEKLQLADSIFIESLYHSNLYYETSQAFAVFIPVNSVGVVGDARQFAPVIGLRAVITDDFMTAQWAKLPYDFLEKVSLRIVNEVPGISRVVYDITGKPPATIEWE